MELRIEPLAGSTTRVVPVGSWDVAGAMAIESRLSAVTGSGRSLVVDMSEVTFLSSMGIRSIVMSAKAAALKGAKLALFAPPEKITAVLIATGIDTLVPICGDLDAALRAVGAGG